MRTPLLFAFVAFGVCACHGPRALVSHAPHALPAPTSSARVAGSAARSKALPGVDTADLSDREQGIFGQLVTELYAPCSEQAVTLAQCVDEARPCAGCLGGARLLARRLRAGASGPSAEKAYIARFAKNTKRTAIDDSPSRGPENAPVTIVVWTDFDCPHCRLSMPVLDEAFERFSPSVRLVHKFYPLASHVNADGAARAAAAAMQQGRFSEMEAVLFDHQGALGPSELESYAELAGLDLTRFRADLKSDLVRQIVTRDRAEADAAGLTGTPFILINGRELDLALFRLRDELEPWIALEIELAAAAVKRDASRKPPE